ncbi:MAG: hypothetical protein EP330_30480 [Deltaproteobacteria bacterium]|nr:MAG: hypothetical protein EP330_30480 [Deltaproteobacteria bacterium]
MQGVLAIWLGLCGVARAEGPLDGLVVYLSAGHGYVAHDRGEGWQRPVSHGLLEDTWTARFVTRELVPALERSGATVLTARERDPHRERVVVDDLDPGFTGVGEARDGHTLVEPGAAWTLGAPHSGTWQLYARWKADETHASQATYTVHTPSGTTTHTVDQRHHGDEWWPLSRLDLDAGDWVKVTLDGEGPLSADAIRLGGGSYTVTTKEGELRQVRAWEAASIHHFAAEGVPEDVWSVPGGGVAGDASARARWAEWSHPEDEEAVYLSIHTDAGGGTGTTAFVRRRCSTCDERSVRSTALADALRTELVDAVRRDHAPEWQDRGTRGAHFAEVSDELNPSLPAVLLELGFHDHPEDAAQLADPAFQATVADALVRGLVTWRSPAAEAPPGPVAEVRWRDESLTWQPSAAKTAGEADQWRVRARFGAARWTDLGTTDQASFQVPEDAVEIEISAIGPGGEGRPIRLERAEPAVAEGGS